MTFICINCKKELPFFYTFTTLELTDETNNMQTYGHTERKVHIIELRKQKISVLCPLCELETPILTKEEIYDIENKPIIQETRIPKPFDRFIS